MSDDRRYTLAEINDQRVRVMDDVMAGYCGHCGGLQPSSGRRCQCGNDE